MKHKKKVSKGKKFVKKVIEKKPEVKRRTYLTPSQLKFFKQMLLRIKNMVTNNIEEIEKSSLSKSQMESSGNISSLPSHIADLGSDSYEQDFNITLVESSRDKLQEIEEALERIEEKEYGICENCSKNIPIERLKAIPYAHLCIKCQEEEEGRGRG